MDQPRQKPLTCLSALCVLPYMSFELRLKLCERSRSLQYTDSSIPTTLNHFEMTKNSFKINDTMYGLDLIRHHFEAVPSRFETLKTWCHPDVNDSQEVLEVSQPTREETNQNFLNEKKLCQKIEWLKESNQRFNYTGVEGDVRQLREKIRDYKEKLAFSRAKLDHYFVLTRKVNKTVTKEYVRYERSYKDALRYLTEKILEGRKIQVKQINRVGGLSEVSPNTLTIEATEPECIIRIKDHKIVSIEFPTRNNAVFTDLLRPQFTSSATPCMLFTFQVASNKFDRTMKTLIGMMKEPLNEAQIEAVRRVREKNLPVKFTIEEVIKITLHIEVKDIRGIGEPGEDYSVKIKATSFTSSLELSPIGHRLVVLVPRGIP